MVCAFFDPSKTGHFGQQLARNDALFDEFWLIVCRKSQLSIKPIRTFPPATEGQQTPLATLLSNLLQMRTALEGLKRVAK